MHPIRLYPTLFTFILIFYAHPLSAQNVSISQDTNASPDPSALLDLQSTQHGLLAPRLTETQRDSMSQPATGLLIYQLDTDPGFYFFDGTNWKPINEIRGVLQDDFVIGQEDPNIPNHLLQNSIPTSLFDTSGIIRDDGGAFGNYSDNFDGEVNLLGPNFNGDQLGLRLQINSLNLHESDTLTIRINTDVDQFQTFKYTNVVDTLLLPFGIEFASIQFESDGAINDAGFEIRFDWMYLQEQQPTGTEKRLGWFFDPSKAAMRGGVDFVNAWNGDSLGRASFSYGQNLKVIGKESVAFGRNNRVIGAFSGAIGKRNRIDDFGSFSYGQGNEITGRNSFAGGLGSFASGSNAVALGESDALGDFSMAFGQSIAQNQYAFAVGEDNVAEGIHSVAFGLDNWAEAQNTFVAGYELRARSRYESVFGRYNVQDPPLSTGGWADEDPLFVVGNGTSFEARNALTILKNGNLGIGIPQPQSPLHVRADEGLGVINVANFENSATSFSSIELDAKEDIPLIIAYDALQGNVQFSRNSNTPFSIDWNQDVNGRVGIGTSQPQSKLHVNGRIEVDDAIIAEDAGGLSLQTDEGTTRFYMSDNGNIGIGTTTPESKLHVAGGIRVRQDIQAENSQGIALRTDDGFIRLYIPDNGNIGIGTATPQSLLHVSGHLTVGDVIQAEDVGGLALRSDDGVTRLKVSDNGNIGIGTTTPESTLDVNGIITVANGIKADNSSGLPLATDDQLIRIMIVDDGKVGVGTILPQSILHVNGPITADEVIQAESTAGLALRSDDGINRLKVHDDGRIGIGTSSPDAQLAVSAEGINDAMRVRVPAGTRFRVFNNGHVRIGQNSGATSSQLNVTALENTSALRAQIGGSTRFMVHANGGVSVGSSTAPDVNGIRVAGSYAAKSGGGSWSATSDIRLKNVHGDYADGLEQLLKIHPVQYSYNGLSGYDTSEMHIGVVAQELQQVAPYMIGSFEKEGEEYLSVDNSAMVYMLINAVKEQQVMIDQQQKQIEQQAKLIEDMLSKVGG